MNKVLGNNNLINIDRIIIELEVIMFDIYFI